MTATLALLLVAASPVFRATVIVGVNDAFEPGQRALQFADDDAARYYELFEARSNRIEVLSVLDADSQPLFPDVARVARVPTSMEVRAALQRAGDEAELARGEGRKTELVFVYIGHGRVVGGVGEVRLLQGVLDRTRLHEWVFGARGFDRTHVIVDACSAYHLVNARGQAEDVDAAFETFLEGQGLDAHPSAGVILATSGEAETHEWTPIRGGLFSHEVRSGLLGAADVGGDGRVAYDELGAFLVAANAEISAGLTPPRVFVRPPRLERDSTLTLTSTRGILLGPEVAGHLIVWDDRSLRYAELHKAGGIPAYIETMPNRDYVVEKPTGEIVARVGRELARAKRPRGEDMPPIFARPFGPDFVEGYRAHSSVDVAVSTPPRSRWIGWISLGIGSALLVFSAHQTAGALSDYQDYRSTFEAGERDRLEESVGRHRTWAIGLGAVGGLGAILGLWQVSCEQVLCF